MKKSILKSITACIISAMLICPLISVNADGGFTLKLSADKTSELKVGDTVSLKITPTDISFNEGICSYDISEITYDANVLTFDEQDYSVDKQDFEIYANKTADGKIKIMVVDMSMTGSSLKDGEGAATLKFKVKAQTEKTVISIKNGEINGTVANAALDSCEGTAGDDIQLSMSGISETASQTPTASDDNTDSQTQSSAQNEITENSIPDENTIGVTSADTQVSSNATDSTASPNETDSTASSQEQNGDPKSDNTWIWIALIVLVAAAAIGGVVFFNKKKSAE